MIRIIWLEMKHFIVSHTKLFLLSAIAFAFSCVAINITVTDYLLLKKEQAAVEENYGDKCFYKINLSGDEEVFANFFNGQNAEKIKEVFDQLCADDTFSYRYEIANAVEFFSIEDSSYGKEDFPDFPQECVYGYEEGNPAVYEDYLQLKGIFADHLFSEEPEITLSEGSWFSEDDFYVDNSEDIHLPVILGSAYRDYYKIGDVLTNAHIATEESITLDVIGFFEQGSSFYDNNNTKVLLNRYMVVPSVEPVYEYHQSDGSVDTFFQYAYDATKIMNARVICEKENAEEVKQTVNQIFLQNGLYELRLMDETESAEKAVKESKDLTTSCASISFVVIGFCTVVYGIQLYYKLLKDKRKYGVFRLNGITKRQLFLLMITDTIAVFLTADILFLLFWHFNAGRGMEGLGLTSVTFVVIPSIELLILAVMGILGAEKINQMNMSGALRENE